MRAHALDEVLQLQLKRFVLRNRHRLAHDPLAAELADDGGIFGVEQLLQQRALPLVVPGDAIDESLLGAVVERDIAGPRAPAKDTDLSHPLRADAACGE